MRWPSGSAAASSASRPPFFATRGGVAPSGESRTIQQIQLGTTMSRLRAALSFRLSSVGFGDVIRAPPRRVDSDGSGLSKRLLMRLSVRRVLTHPALLILRLFSRYPSLGEPPNRGMPISRKTTESVCALPTSTRNEYRSRALRARRSWQDAFSPGTPPARGLTANRRLPL
jgi:hypothetical protein